MMCQQALCVANRCTTRESPPVDLDRDGFGALPCGNDCDDRNPARFVGMFESCDLVDNDCDELVDEGSRPTFLPGQLTTDVLGAAPAMVDSTPGILFISRFGGRALEVRWVGTESSLIGLASVGDTVDVAAVRSLGGGRAEIVWSSAIAPISLRRTLVRVEVGASVSILIERTETLALLPSRPSAIRLEGDAIGAAVLVATAETTLLVLPGLAPIPVAPFALDLAVAGGIVVFPSDADTLTAHDRTLGTRVGTVDLSAPLDSNDPLVAWGTRLFAYNATQLTEIDPATLREVRSVDIGIHTNAFFGAGARELLFADFDSNVVGLDADLRMTPHASLLSTLPGQHQIFELGTHVVVVSTGTGSTTYQVEQCGS